MDFFDHTQIENKGIIARLIGRVRIPVDVATMEQSFKWLFVIVMKAQVVYMGRDVR